MFSNSKLFALVSFIVLFAHVSSEVILTDSQFESSLNSLKQIVIKSKDSEKVCMATQSLSDLITKTKNEKKQYKVLTTLTNLITETKNEKKQYKVLTTLTNLRTESKEKKACFYQSLANMVKHYGCSGWGAQAIEILKLQASSSQTNDDVTAIITALMNVGKIDNTQQCSKTIFSAFVDIIQSESNNAPVLVIQHWKTMLTSFSQPQLYTKIIDKMKILSSNLKGKAQDAVEKELKFMSTYKSTLRESACVINALNSRDKNEEHFLPTLSIKEECSSLAEIDENQYFNEVFGRLNKDYSHMSKKESYLGELKKEMKDLRVKFISPKKPSAELKDDVNEFR